MTRQQLWCHECERHVVFDIDLSLDGNHVLKCPNCGHEHCRVVKNGRITGERWDSRNGVTYIMYAVATTSTDIQVYSLDWIMGDAWLSTTTTSY